jgi:hypothetical protein
VYPLDYLAAPTSAGTILHVTRKRTGGKGKTPRLGALEGAAFHAGWKAGEFGRSRPRRSWGRGRSGSSVLGGGLAVADHPADSSSPDERESLFVLRQIADPELFGQRAEVQFDGRDREEQLVGYLAVRRRRCERVAVGQGAAQGREHLALSRR